MSMFDSAVNVQRTRINSDKTSNNYGSQLLDFLKLNCLYILKGRTNMDIPGKTTCKSTSTVDYWRPRRSAAPLMEWNQILWKGGSNFSGFLLVGYNSRLFRLVEGVWLFKICTMNSELGNFVMQIYSNEIIFSVN
jgi:hypothetical protein